MKLIHISDLHLGRTLNQISLIDDQRVMLMNRILPVVKEKKPDVLLIAGDIYDNYSPTYDAMNLLDDFMLQVHELGIKILIIGGNHDSGIRVDHHHELLEASGCYLYGGYNGKTVKVTLQDEYGPVNFYLLPYITPEIIRPSHESVDSKTSYDEAVGIAIDDMMIDKMERNVILSHQYVSGSERTMSDTKPLVGSTSETDQIKASRYQDFDYVALGHIHKHYSLLDGHAVYPGSLLPYHYNEQNERSISYVELREKGNFYQEDIKVEIPHEIRIYRGTMDEILSRTDDKEHYVYVIFTDEKVSPTLGSELRRKFPLFLGSRRETTQKDEDDSSSFSVSIEKSPLETIMEFYTKANHNEEPSEKEIELIKEILEECQSEALAKEE